MSTPAAEAPTPRALLAATLVALIGAPGLGAEPSGTRASAPLQAAADTLPEPRAPGDWNAPRALEIVRTVAEARRRHPYGDTALHSFRARAEGHTYFLFDPGPAASLLGAPGGTRLVRADQVALRIAWRRPGYSRQTIVGRRSERLLPTRIQYHADHLRVLLENFDSTISMGRGTEVRNVPHPAAPGALSAYEYRLADSLEVRLAGERRRLYRLQVRPRDRTRPAVVGEMFVDGDEPAVARLSVTFTPPSYRDPQLQHVSVDLESGLIDGEYWLPVRQTTEVHRQSTWLDVPAGGTIRTRFRVTDYELNPGDPVRVSPGERLVSRPDSVLARYEGWERGLFQGPAGGTRQPGTGDVDLREVRERARRLVGRRTLSGLAPSRLYLPDASHAVRVRRGEGVLVGAGVRHRGAGWEASAWAGYPFGAERPETRVAVGSEGRSGPVVQGCLRCLSDIGPFAASSGVGASLSALAGSGDFRDPWFRSGAEAAWRFPLGGGGLRLAAAWEEHVAAAAVPGPQSGPDARPVRPIREGETARLSAGVEAPQGRFLGAGWRAELSAEGATEEAGDFGYSRALLRVEGRSPPPAEQPVSWSLRLAAGAAGGDVPAQRLFLLGGRGTVSGYRFRPWGGDRVLLGQLGAAVDVAPPWIRARARASAGWTGIGGAGERAARRLGVGESGGVRPSVGAGVGLFWDLLRVNVDRGLRNGRWSLNVSVDPEFWPVL